MSMTNTSAEAAEQFKAEAKFSDFRKAIAHNGVDVVINGTPDHWHTLVNIHALRAGKDVYSEKPLTLTIDEGQKLVEVASQTGRILQTGSQQRSDAALSPGVRAGAQRPRRQAETRRR